PGASMFRPNRIKPHGAASRRNARSSAVMRGPDSPVMKAAAVMCAFGLSGPKWPPTRAANRRPASVTPAAIARTGETKVQRPDVHRQGCYRDAPPISPPATGGSRSRVSILLDKAGATLRFQVVAQLVGLLAGGERTDLGAVIGALLAEVLAADDD